MPAPHRHLAQARANRDHAEQLLASAPHDPTALQWAVTAAFYCALHCPQAHLVARGIDPRTHIKRDEALADPVNMVPNDVIAAYEWHKQRSEGGRYRLWRFTATQVRQQVLDTHLAKVTAFVGL